MRQGSTTVTPILFAALLAGCGGTPRPWVEVYSLFVASSQCRFDASCTLAARRV